MIAPVIFVLVVLCLLMAAFMLYGRVDVEGSKANSMRAYAWVGIALTLLYLNSQLN